MQADAPKPITTIQPARGWQFPNLRETWAYRGVVANFVRRNITITYRQTIGGPIYAVYTPFMTMIGYSILLGGLFNAQTDGDIPYPLFTFSALLPWTLFTGTLSATSISLTKNANFVQKIYIPRFIFPLIEASMALVEFGIAFVVLLLMMLLYGYPLTANVLLLPVFIVLASGCALGIGLGFAGLHARFRDTTYVVGVITKGLFFLTPVVYSSGILPAPWDVLYRLNPIAVVVEGFRWSLLGVGMPPTLGGMAYTTVFVVVMLVVGGLTFRRLEATIADVM